MKWYRSTEVAKEFRRVIALPLAIITSSCPCPQLPLSKSTYICAAVVAVVCACNSQRSYTQRGGQCIYLSIAFHVVVVVEDYCNDSENCFVAVPCDGFLSVHSVFIHFFFFLAALRFPALDRT
uniref:Uncharacterized protein n=1 Tax=Trypanosoma vivax (strain Y486) TaxID=1055687 RepID=G0TWV5_TRYVY|nr:hypothetical protein TVY486_0602340 [Trypanosoma vivax Y486]